MQRVPDRLIGVAALVVFGPLLILLAAAVRLGIGGPMFERRRHLDGRPADALCFRVNTSPLGRFLAAHRLDRLPLVLDLVSGRARWGGR